MLISQFSMNKTVVSNPITGDISDSTPMKLNDVSVIVVVLPEMNKIPAYTLSAVKEHPFIVNYESVTEYISPSRLPSMLKVSKVLLFIINLSLA